MVRINWLWLSVSLLQRWSSLPGSSGESGSSKPTPARHLHKRPAWSTAGFPMPGDLAPDFTLSDQFGQTQTLSALRGTRGCPGVHRLALQDALPADCDDHVQCQAAAGGSAASKIALVAVNANPDATSVTEVQTWSLDHGMLHQWLFLTGTSEQLQSIYQCYHVYDAVASDGRWCMIPSCSSLMPRDTSAFPTRRLTPMPRPT